MKPLTADERKDVFIIDDSRFDRSRSKRTELPAKVFDHCSMKYRRGYRMLTLEWPDGNPFVPVNHCFLSAADDKNLLCEAAYDDGRPLAGKRRSPSRRKATDVMISDPFRSGNRNYGQARSIWQLVFFTKDNPGIKVKKKVWMSSPWSRKAVR